MKTLQLPSVDAMFEAVAKDVKNFRVDKVLSRDVLNVDGKGCVGFLLRVEGNERCLVVSYATWIQGWNALPAGDWRKALQLRIGRNTVAQLLQEGVQPEALPDAVSAVGRKAGWIRDGVTWGRGILHDVVWSFLISDNLVFPKNDGPPIT